MPFDIGDVLTGLLNGPPAPEASGPDLGRAAATLPPTSDSPDLATIPAKAPIAEPGEAVPIAGSGNPADGEQLTLLADSPEPAGPFADWGLSPDTQGRIGFQAPDAPVPWPADEDLIDPDAPPPTRDPTAGPCPWCGRRAWWRSIHGAVVCGYCHPPAVPGLVAEPTGGTFHGANSRVESGP